MALKMEYHSNLNFIKNEFPLKIYVTQNGMSLKMVCHSKWNVPQSGMSLKMKCHSKWIVTQNRMSFNIECQ